MHGIARKPRVALLVILHAQMPCAMTKNALADVMRLEVAESFPKVVSYAAGAAKRHRRKSDLCEAPAMARLARLCPEVSCESPFQLGEFFLQFADSYANDRIGIAP